MFDSHNTTKFSRAISPVSVGDNTAQVSQILDTAGFAKNEIAIATGSLADADATFAVTMDEGNVSNLSDASAVAAADLVGSYASASFVFSDDDKTFKLGYKGSKRYIRVTITPTNNASAALMSAMWMQSGARKQPTS
jgi:hypothetical protein